jgi:hemoglobin
MMKAILSVSLMLMSVSAMATGEKGNQSLYDRLGGKEAIQKVVDNFVARVGNDKRINHFFAATVADEARLTGFKAHMVEQICQATGGPCTYKGKDMKSTHSGMAIHGKDFDALVENLTAALNEMKVPKKDQAKLISVLKPMKKDIVEKK